MNLLRDLSRKIYFKKDFEVNFKREGSFIWYSFCVVVTCFLFYMLIGSRIGYNSSFNLLFSGFAILYILLFLIYWFADLDVKFAHQVMKSTIYFAKTNNLIVKEKEKYVSYDKDGNEIIKTRDIISYVPTVVFRVYDDKLVWLIRRDGHKLSKNYDELKEILEGAFRLVCESVDYSVKTGFYEYVFRRNDLSRKSVSDILYQDDNDVVYELVKDSIVLSDDYTWNFRKNPHALITGVTGSGKTFLFAYFLIIFIRIKAIFKIVDPKRADLYYLKKYFDDDVVNTKGQALKILREASEMIDKRMTSFQVRDDYKWGEDYSYYRVKPYFIVFDEAAAFAALLSSKEKVEYDSYLAKIILEGRQAGVFIIFAMQRPDADFLPGAIRDQLGLRVALGHMSQIGYRMVFDEDAKDLVLQDKEAGFVKDLKMQTPREFYTPFLDIDFIAELERLIRYKKKIVDDSEEIV